MNSLRQTVPIQPIGPRRFHVISKPVGSLCNLDCTYCYYLSKEKLLNQPVKPVFSDEMLERFIQQYIESNQGPEVVFTWQGGEPTLLGLPWFEKVLALQARHARSGQRVLNDLQTNGVKLDAQWATFLKTHDFMVGLSIDGPAHLHDMHRFHKGKTPTHEKVMHAVGLLHEHGVPFSTLTCVQRDNARHALEVYRFLRDEVGSTRMQFIPIVEPRRFESQAPDRSGHRPAMGHPSTHPDHPLSIVTPWSVAAADWGEFLVSVFEEWRQHDLGRVLVNWFETMVSWRLGHGAQMCVTNDFCGKNLAIEHDGTVYACDHYVYPEYALGNIEQRSLGELAFNAQQIRFGQAKRDTLPTYCRSCPWLQDCWGECPKNRLISTPQGEAGLNYLCEGFRRFYGHAAPMIDLAMKRKPASRAAG